MKVKAYGIGKCGVENLFYAGSVSYDTIGAANGVELCALPHKAIITRAVAVVKTAFNAATTNVLTVGNNSAVNDILDSSDVTEGTAGVYSKDLFLELGAGEKIKVKYTQTGTAATAGAADIYLFAVGIPD